MRDQTQSLMISLLPALRRLTLSFFLPLLVSLGSCATNLYEDAAADAQPKPAADASVPNFEPSFLFDVQAATGAIGNQDRDALFVLSDGSIGLFTGSNTSDYYLHLDTDGRLLHEVDLRAALGTSDLYTVYASHLYGDHLLLESPRTAYFFDLSSGTVAWRIHPEGSIYRRESGLFIYNTPCPGEQTIQSVNTATGEVRDLLSWPFVPGHPRVYLAEIDWLDAPASDAEGAGEAFAKTLYVTIDGSKDTVIDGATRQLSYVTSALYDAETLAPLRETRRATRLDGYRSDFRSLSERGPRRALRLDKQTWAEDVRTGDVFWRKPSTEMPTVSGSGSGGYRVISGEMLFGETFDSHLLGYVLHVPTGSLLPVSKPRNSRTYGNTYVAGPNHFAFSESTGDVMIVDRATSAVVRTFGPLFAVRYPPAPRVTYVPAGDRLVFYTGQHLYAVDGATRGK